MVSPQIATLLTQLAAAESDVRNKAETELARYHEEDKHGLVQQLAFVIADPNLNMYLRAQAGVILKNKFSSSSSEADDVLKRTEWTNLPQELCGFVKKAALSVIRAEDQPALVRDVAAQIVGKIARLELPNRSPDDFVANIAPLMAASNSQLRRICMVSLGFICEDITLLPGERHKNVDPDVTNQIISAVVMGLRDSDLEVRKEAIDALNHLITFADQNIENTTERSMILTSLAPTLDSEHVDIRRAAWEVAAKLVSDFYQFLTPQEIFTIGRSSLEQMKNDITRASGVLEFWTTLCEEEYDRNVPHAASYIRMAILELFPLLLDALSCATASDDIIEEDEFTAPKAALCTLGKLTVYLEDEMVEPSVKFIMEHFTSESAAHRDAALMLLGTIMEGSTPAAVHALIRDAAPALRQRLQDSNKNVRDTAAWAIGRIAHHHPALFLPTIETSPDGGPPPIITALVQLFEDEASVAAQACITLNEIIGQVPTPLPAEISGILVPLTNQLYSTATKDSNDLSSSHLSRCAFETLCTTVMLSNENQIPNLSEMLLNLVTLLNTKVSKATAEHCGDHSGLIAAIGTLMLKVPQDQSAGVEDTIVRLMVHIFGSGGQFGVMAEEAVRTLGTVATKLGPKFRKYLTLTIDWLVQAVQTYDDENLSSWSVEVLGDICRAVGSGCEAIHNKVFSVLTDALRHSTSPAVKPKIMYAIADLAMSMGPSFEQYFACTMEILGQATRLSFDDNPTDADYIEYVCELRHGVLQAYLASVVCMGRKPAGIQPFVPVMMSFISDIVGRPQSSEENLCAAADLASDLVVLFKREVPAQFVQEMRLITSKFMERSKESENVRMSVEKLNMMLMRFT